MFALAKRLHLADFAALFLLCIVAGVVTGALMNAINGLISPLYFQLFFYFSNGTSGSPSLYVDTVCEGCLEGFNLGLLIAIAFSTWVFAVSRSACSWRRAAPYIGKMLFIVFAFWFLGGFNGALLGAFAPSFPPNPLVPSLLSRLPLRDRCAFGWVGGSIDGAYVGALFALVLGCSWFRRDWHKRQR